MSRPLQNNSKIWQEYLPVPKLTDNKYSRGHAVVIGGAEHTGAARLAAMAALRIGAGLVTVACPAEAFAIYASSLLAVMVKSIDKNFDEFIDDERKNAVCIGPGAGVAASTKEMVLDVLKLGKNVVIDADALTVFQDEPEELFAAVKKSIGEAVLTPHEGEFARIFSLEGSREEKALRAAELSGAVVLLKEIKL